MNYAFSKTKSNMRLFVTRDVVSKKNKKTPETLSNSETILLKQV